MPSMNCPTVSTDWLVTDHAVVRYLERVMGVDVDAVRAKILADGRRDLLPKIRFGKIRIADGSVVLKVREGRVVTVQTAEKSRDRASRLSAAPRRRK